MTADILVVLAHPPDTQADYRSSDIEEVWAVQGVLCSFFAMDEFAAISTLTERTGVLECDVNLTDRDIIDVCGGVVSIKQEEGCPATTPLPPPGNLATSHVISNLIEQLSRLKQDLDLSLTSPLLNKPLTLSGPALIPFQSGLKHGPATLLTPDITTLLTRDITTRPRLPVIIRSISLSPLSSPSFEEQLQVQMKSYAKDDLDLRLREMLSSNVEHSVSCLQTAPSTSTSSFLERSPDRPTTSLHQHVNKILPRSAGHSAWSPYTKDSEKTPETSSVGDRVISADVKESSPTPDSPLYNFNNREDKSFECKYCNYQAKQYNQLVSRVRLLSNAP